MRWIIPPRLSLFGMFVALTLQACIKDEDDLASQDCLNACATIRGRITTDDNQPLAGIQVTATYELPALPFKQITRKKAATYSDDRGNYKLRFEIRNDELDAGTFMVEILTPSVYFACSHDHPVLLFSRLTNDSTIVRDVYAPYRAYLNINSTGTEKITQSQYMVVGIQAEDQKDDQWCIQTFDWSFGNRDAVYKPSVQANQKLIISTMINKNEVRTTTYDTLVINRGETLNYTAGFK